MVPSRLTTFLIGAVIAMCSCVPRDFVKVDCPPTVLVPKSCDQAFALYTRDRSLDASATLDLLNVDVGTDLVLRNDIVRLGEEMDQVTQRLSLSLKTLCQEERAAACDVEAASEVRTRKELLLAGYAQIDQAAGRLEETTTGDLGVIERQVHEVRIALEQLQSGLDPLTYLAVELPLAEHPATAATGESQARPLLMGSAEVSQSLWAEVYTSPSDSPRPTDACSSFGHDAEQPMTCLTWCEAAAFANELSRVGSLTLAYDITFTESDACAVETVPGSNGYRLPTQSEWMDAAATGEVTPWSSLVASASDCAAANLRDQAALGHERFDAWGHRAQDFLACDDGYPGPWAVGTGRRNAWGLSDMVGNVSEWVMPDDSNALHSRSLPMVCGGSFAAETGALGENACRSVGFSFRDDTVGLRLVRAP